MLTMFSYNYKMVDKEIYRIGITNIVGASQVHKHSPQCPAYINPSNSFSSSYNMR